MKKVLLITLTVATLISCQKYNLTLNHHWVAEAYHDNQPLDHAFTCDSSDYLGIDTIDLVNTRAIDSTKFYPEVGTIVYDLRGAIAGNRWYHRLLKQID